MKQKNFLEADIAKIFKIELGIKVKKNNKIYDHDKWDSLGNFNGRRKDEGALLICSVVGG